MKRPSFQFYPADWRKDPALSSCSLAARGLWVEMMCVAHEGDEYGYLTINGNAMDVAQIARAVGAEQKEVGRLLAELEHAGVFSRDARGAIFSRRMVKDERLRNTRADCGRLGGNPNLLNQNSNQSINQNSATRVNQSVNQSPTPSSSSSSSKNLKPLSSAAPPPGFERFWRIYPPRRRVAKLRCVESWARARCEDVVDAVVAHVEAMKASEQWREGYEPAPLTYLNQRRWEDGLPIQKPRGPAL